MEMCMMLQNLMPHDNIYIYIIEESNLKIFHLGKIKIYNTGIYNYILCAF